MTRLVISGSRSLEDEDAYKKLCEMVDIIVKTFGPLEEIIHGACPKGADVLADMYAKTNRIPLKTYPAQWKKTDGTVDKGAGFRRNSIMAEYADVGIALWDGESNGTKHMISELSRLDKPFYVAYIRKGYT